jgi:hypothetical protein
MLALIYFSKSARSRRALGFLWGILCETFNCTKFGYHQARRLHE